MVYIWTACLCLDWLSMSNLFMVLYMILGRVSNVFLIEGKNMFLTRQHFFQLAWCCATMKPQTKPMSGRSPGRVGGGVGGGGGGGGGVGGSPPAAQTRKQFLHTQQKLLATKYPFLSVDQIRGKSVQLWAAHSATTGSIDRWEVRGLGNNYIWNVCRFKSYNYAK